MKILIDQDEVLCSWSEPMRRLWNDEHIDDPDRHVEEVKIWSTNTFLGEGSKHFVRCHMRDEEFWANLPPIPYATGGIEALYTEGHDVRIVTQVLPEAAGPSYSGKIRWIRKHLPWFDLGHLIVTKDKASVVGDVLLDDAPHQLEAFRDRGTGEAVALAYEWNKHVKCERVRNWVEFVEWIRRRDRER